MLRMTGILLVVALLYGQAALLHHEYDFAAHKSGHTCVTCLHATPLSHALSGSVSLALSLPIANTEFHFTSAHIIAITRRAYRARAPPSAASV